MEDEFLSLGTETTAEKEEKNYLYRSCINLTVVMPVMHYTKSICVYMRSVVYINRIFEGDFIMAYSMMYV